MEASSLNDNIQNRQRLGRKVAFAEAMHIVYGIDDQFVVPMGAAMISILKNNPDESIVFHILTESLSEKNIKGLEKLTNDYQSTILIHYIAGEAFATLPYTDHFTKAMYNRFLLPKALKGITDKAIYLDADILCYHSLAELKGLDFKGCTVAVVQDIGAVADRQISALSLKRRQYFNTGFLYIDIEQWESRCVSEQALAFSLAHLGELNWPDQDALNVVLNDQALFIEEKYNYIFDFGIRENRNIKKLPEGTVLAHFAGRFKPWHAWCLHPLKQDFLHYVHLSPWHDIAIQAPCHYKEMKKMAQSYLLYGKNIEAMVWYMRYAIHKIIRKR